MAEIPQDPNDISPADGGEVGPAPSPGEVIPDRKKEARGYREDEAERARLRDPEPRRNRNNGEEQTLRNPDTGELSYAANATKGMPHDELGEVIAGFRQRVDAYEILLRAVNSESPDDFAAIPTGPARDIITDQQFRPFVDPQSGLAFDLEGPDPPTLTTYRGVGRRGLLNKQPILLTPRFPTPEIAADIGEIYLMALSRDVHVTALQGAGASPDARVNDAVRLLSQFSGYRGPVDPTTETVTPQSLFRGGNVLAENGPSSQNEGELVGPYLSQFLIIGSRIDGAFPPAIAPETGDKSEAGLAATGVTLRRDQGQVLYGTVTLDQRQFEVVPGVDFVTDYDTWLQVLQGVRPKDLDNPNDRSSRYTGQRRFLYSLRQMSEYVHRDQTYQEGLIAALLIISMNERAGRLAERARREGLPPPPPLFNPGNAYADVPNQMGFASFGNPHVLALLAEANTRAIKAAWSGKWVNHRWIRPEVLAGRIHNVVTERVKPSRYSLNAEITGVPVDVIGGNDPIGDTDPGKEIMELVRAYNKAQNAANGRPTDPSFLLPQAYPEGSPVHPTYPAGHATQIAAEVTVLKGLFNEAFPITDATPRAGQPIPSDLDVALVPNADGTKLDPYRGPNSDQPLTLGDELNKLAANVAISRSVAGVHYRIDYSESMLLGEYVGLGILQEQARSYNQARRSTVTRDDPFFFELTLFSGVKVRVLADGTIVTV